MAARTRIEVAAMNFSARGAKVEMIPIEQINDLESASRGQAKFRQIIDNIVKLGLKPPITVVRRTTQAGSFLHDGMYGQAQDGWKRVVRMDRPLFRPSCWT